MCGRISMRTSCSQSVIASVFSPDGRQPELHIALDGFPQYQYVSHRMADCTGYPDKVILCAHGS